MAFVIVQGGIKAEPTLVKIKAEPENTVEICIDDILDSSDEENIPNIETQDVKEVGNNLYAKKENISKSSSNNKCLNKKDKESNEVADGKDTDSDEDEQNDSEDFNAVDNLQTNEQLVLNFSNDLEAGIHISTRKLDFPNPYKTFELTGIQEDMKKIKVIKAPLSEVAPHEYTTLAFDKHICNYCQWALGNIKQLKKHIHRELVTMYQCPYCPYKSKWRLRNHIISNHKDDKDIQWFRCHICDMKFKLKYQIIRHCLTHLTSEQLQDRMQTCPVCKKRFKIKAALRRHVQFVHNKAVKERVHCKECEFSTIVPTTLRHHVEVAPHEYTTLAFDKHICNYCQWALGNIKQLKKHIRIKHRELVTMYQCPYCPYKSKWRLRNHIISNHKDDKDIQWFRCHICDMKFKLKYQIIRHCLTHLTSEQLQDRMQTCPVCKKRFKIKAALRRHVQFVHNKAVKERVHCKECEFSTIVPTTLRHHVEVAPHEYTTLAFDKHICNYCQWALGNIKQLKKHIRIKHRELVTMYQCPYCPYKSKWRLRNHIISNHKDDKDIQWFRCHICDMKFKLKYQIIRHCLTHLTSEQLQDRMQTCPVCKKRFKIKAALRRHVQFVHNKAVKERVHCKECEFSTIVPTTLRHHVEEYHSNSPPLRTYTCTKCEFTARYKHRLTNHLKTHNLRHVCEICSFACSTSSQLKMHQLSHKKKVDELDLKYRCDKCDYKTYRQYSLQIHLLNHLKLHEIQYFYCYHCEFKAKRKDNLKRHVLRHFKKEEVSFQCFICDFSTEKRQSLIKHIDKHAIEKKT